MDEGTEGSARWNRPIVPVHVDAHLETGGAVEIYWTVRRPVRATNVRLTK
jgi:hypothetical protein